MKSKAGIVLMLLGAVLLLGALGLLLYNQRQARQAEQVSAQVLPALMEQVARESRETEPEVPTANIPEALLTPEDLAMAEAEIDGYSYIGWISIPALNLELPVMSNWSYLQLRIAPCRYAGTVLGGDLVLMAHNYARHFGGLSGLERGEKVYFTDVQGKTYGYEVVALDVLQPTAVEEMTAGVFDLTLFTCTYGGKTRMTVYCDMIKE